MVWNTVAPTVVTPEGLDPVDIAPLTESTTTAAVPLPQLAVLLGLALILAALLAGRTRSRRRVAALVEQAKEEGRREAAHQPS